MLEFIRKHQRIVLILFGLLIIPSFVFWGLGDYQGFTSNDVNLVEIKKNKITEDDFNRSWRSRLDQLRQQNGNDFDISEVDVPENRAYWLDQLINEQVLQSIASEKKYNASDAMIMKEIANDSQFQKDGKFDLEKYKNFLSRAGVSAEMYQNSVRYGVATQEVIRPVLDTYQIPSKLSGALIDNFAQEREVSLHIMDTKSYLDEMDDVSEDDAKNWFENHKKDFETTHFVDAEYILLNKDVALKSVETPSDEEAKEYYEANKKRFTKAERRTVNHIQINIPKDASLEEQQELEKKAQKIANEAKEDQAEFAQLAKEHSDDLGTKNLGGELGVLSPEDIPELDQAIFSNSEKGIYDPVQIDNAYHIIQVTHIDKGEVKDFDSAKNEIIDEIKLQLASDKFADLATDLTNLVEDHRDSLKPAVDQMQVELKTMEGVTQAGLLDDETESDEAKLFENPRVREALFSHEGLKEGLNSSVIEISPSELIAVRVKKDHPARIPEFDEIKKDVLLAYKTEKALHQLDEKSEKLLNSLKERKEKDTVDFKETITVNRLTGQYPEPMVNAIMKAPATDLPTYTRFTTPQGYVIARIDKINPVDESLVKLLESELPSLLAGAKSELEQGVMDTLRKDLKVKKTKEAQKVIQSSDEAS